MMEISDGISEELLNAFRSVGTKHEFKLHSNTIDIQLREESYKLNSYFILDLGYSNGLWEILKNTFHT